MRNLGTWVTHCLFLFLLSSGSPFHTINTLYIVKDNRIFSPEMRPPLPKINTQSRGNEALTEKYVKKKMTCLAMWLQWSMLNYLAFFYAQATMQNSCLFFCSIVARKLVPISLTVLDYISFTDVYFICIKRYHGRHFIFRVKTYCLLFDQPVHLLTLLTLYK